MNPNLPELQPPRNMTFRDYDAACRFRDALAVAQLAISKDEILRGRWIVVRLSDGSTDGQVYETQQDAFRHAPGLETLFLYIRVPLERLSEHVTDVLLWYARKMYDAGWRPDIDNPSLRMPNSPEEMFRGLRRAAGSN